MLNTVSFKLIVNVSVNSLEDDSEEIPIDDVDELEDLADEAVDAEHENV